MMNNRTQFTSYMQNTVSGLFDRIGTFYCREDVARKVKEVMTQREKKLSGYHSRLKELNEMCEMCGVDAGDLCDPETREAELSKIPTRAELRQNFIRELYDIYLEFPSSVQFMDRLVRRLLKGQFENDSLRLAIAKKFLLETDYCTKPVIDLAESRMEKEAKQQYDALSGEEKLHFLLDQMDDSIFDVLNQDLDSASWQTLLRKQIRINEADTFTLSDSLAEKLGSADPLTVLDTLRSEEELTAIEKEFCAYLKQFTYQKKKQKSPGKPATKDEIYKQAKKDLRKARKNAWTMLKLCDDLASGKFRVNGMTREQLYIFAVAFGMNAGDVEKNLFHDYYNDNLLRYVTDEEYLQNITNYEAEPTGEGINYKNYVEVIYLYYLSRFPEMSPREKLSKIQSAIDACAKKAKNLQNRVEEAPEAFTAVFKEEFDVLLQLDEQDLENYICTHYYIYNPDFSSARITYSSEQNTARETYRELARQMMEEYPESFGEIDDDIRRAEEKLQKNQITDASRDDVELNNALNLPQLLEILKEDNGPAHIPEDKTFLALLSKLDDKLQTKKRRILDLLDDQAAEAVTRTELITLYYCYFRNVMEELVEDYGIMDLPQLYQEFCHGDGFRLGLNDYLIRCRYQSVSPKNAFDMFVVFALFLELIRWDD